MHIKVVWLPFVCWHKTAMQLAIVLNSPAELLHYDIGLKGHFTQKWNSVIVFSHVVPNLYDSSFCETQKNILYIEFFVLFFLSVFCIDDIGPHWLSKYVLLLFHRRKKAKKGWNRVNLLSNWKKSKPIKSTSFQSNSRYCNLPSLMWCVCYKLYHSYIQSSYAFMFSTLLFFYFPSSKSKLSPSMTAWHTSLINLLLERDQIATLLPILSQGITKSPLILFIL